MSRAKWKSPYFNNLNEIKKYETYSRSSTILPIMVGTILKVHNGKILNKINITEKMLGRKLGEFFLTRKKFNYKKK